MTITLPERIEERLKSAALKRGVAADAFAVELIELALPTASDIDVSLDLAGALGSGRCDG